MNVAQNTVNIQGYVMVLLDVKYCKVDVKLQSKRQALFDVNGLKSEYELSVLSLEGCNCRNGH